MGLGTHRRLAVLMLLMPLGAAGCTHSDVNGQTPPTASPTVSPTIDPRAQPAVAAFQTLQFRSNNALRKPFAPNEKHPSDEDFAAFAFDPFRADYESQVWALEHAGVEFRGTPPTPIIHVRTIDLTASPWPTVTLLFCDTKGEDWHAYYVKTGAQVPETTPKVPAPHEGTATMIKYKNHWGAQKITFDQSRTCSS